MTTLSCDRKISSPMNTQSCQEKRGAGALLVATANRWSRQPNIGSRSMEKNRKAEPAAQSVASVHIPRVTFALQNADDFSHSPWREGVSAVKPARPNTAVLLQPTQLSRAEHSVAVAPR